MRTVILGNLHQPMYIEGEKVRVKNYSDKGRILRESITARLWDEDLSIGVYRNLFYSIPKIDVMMAHKAYLSRTLGML